MELNEEYINLYGMISSTRRVINETQQIGYFISTMYWGNCRSLIAVLFVS